MSRSSFTATGLMLAVSVLAPSRAAEASLIGDLVTVQAFSPDLMTLLGTDNVTVQAGPVEISCPASPLCAQYLVAGDSINIEAMSIVLSFAPGLDFASGAFNGLVFSSLNFSGAAPLTGFLLAVNGLTNLDASDVSFTPSSISINLRSVGGLSDGGSATLTLQTTTQVPEPGTVALMAIAFAGLARHRRRTQ
jgi:hypothetical protein